jgi:signal peptidase I
VDRESFYGRFSTSARSSAAAARESFYGRFSTSTREQQELTVNLGGNWETFMMLIVAFDLVFGLVRPFVAEPMHVPSESMAPTLQVQDRVLTNKLAYDFANPDRGDLVVFESVQATNDEDVVKRVIGLPGDEISAENGVLLVNGEAQDESYVAAEQPPASRKPPGSDSFGPLTVPQDHVFVMGDNRTNSYDSRFFGPVPNENLLGEVSLRFWPLNRLGVP